MWRETAEPFTAFAGLVTVDVAFLTFAGVVTFDFAFTFEGFFALAFDVRAFAADLPARFADAERRNPVLFFAMGGRVAQR